MLPSAHAVKLARVALPPDASDEECLRVLETSLQPTLAEALRALRARAREGGGSAQLSHSQAGVRTRRGAARRPRRSRGGACVA